MGGSMQERLRSVSLFANVPEEEMSCLADANEIHVEPGEFIARQGEAARYFWILISGQMMVSSTLPDGRQSYSARIPPGAALGAVSYTHLTLPTN